jgi:CheY-like chemotaxis protein
MSESIYPLLHGTAVLLCIDDDEDILECEKSFLESFGHTVLVATSGGRGLELATLYAIDIVIVEYLMPEMNGHEFVTKMKSLNPRAPIIMLSAAVNIPQKTLTLVDAVIAKNSLASELLPAIARLHGCRSPFRCDA